MTHTADGATYDVVVVGCGNAALCSAVSAAEQGASVLVIEKAPEPERGGNGVFTGGLMRLAYKDLSDIQTLVQLSETEVAELTVGEYPAASFFEDVAETSDYRSDGELLAVLTEESLATAQWLAGNGVRFVPSIGLHAVRRDGKIYFRGNAPVEVSGGGVGLIEAMLQATAKKNIDVQYGVRAVRLEVSPDDGRIVGLVVDRGDAPTVIGASAIVLACGGFEANPEMRAKYLGPGWDLARVRGTSHNTGDGIRMALALGAEPYGNWSGCHATPTDFNAPRYGDRKVLHTFTRHSYLFGIMVNRYGDRFVDEGEDLETHTYARFGREILRQPAQTAFQIFDATGTELLRDEYRMPQSTRFDAETIPALAVAAGIDVEGVVRTVSQFNAAVTDTPFDPTVKDGKRTAGLPLPKSNWALPIARPPFVAFPVTCGITFSYGGLHITTRGEVMSTGGRTIRGLYAAGEIIGGLFYGNYPTGTGITTGSVFGRIAGASAGQYATSA